MGYQNLNGGYGGGYNSGATSDLVYEFSKRSYEQDEEIRRLRQALEDARVETQAMEDEMSEVEKKVESLSEKLEKATKDNEKLDKDVKNVRNKTIEPLAVFVGLFTFVSVGFNILAAVENPVACFSLLMLLAGGLVVFAALVIHAGSIESDDKGRRWWTAGLIAVGIALAAFGGVMHYHYLQSLPSEEVSTTEEESSL